MATSCAFWPMPHTSKAFRHYEPYNTAAIYTDVMNAGIAGAFAGHCAVTFFCPLRLNLSSRLALHLLPQILPQILPRTG